MERSNIKGIIKKYITAHRMAHANMRIPKVNHILTSEEINIIKSTWGKEFCRGKIKCYEFYKKFCGIFDINYIPNDYYYLAETVLNKGWASSFLQHKCNLKYFIPEINRPVTLLQCIDGHLLGKDDLVINMLDAINLLKSKEEFVFKIAQGTGGGNGVKKIILKTQPDKERYLQDLLSSSKNFIVQECIKQSSFMAGFNFDSVNTIRVLSLNINDQCTVLSSFLRMGGKGSFVDNLSSGGGVLVGINKDGILNYWGIRKNYEQVEVAPSGLVFKNTRIDYYDAIKEFVIQTHKRFCPANLIGWDITVDDNHNIIVIEVNLDSAEIEAHQIFNGPIFGGRIKEVMKYIDNNSSDIKIRL